MKPYKKIIISSYDVYEAVVKLQSRNWRKTKNYHAYASSLMLNGRAFIFNSKGKQTVIKFK